MRIRLFNVKYSPNLGDGLLSECLERALVEHGADPAGTVSVDLSARTEYAPGSTGRGKLLAGLDALPAGVRSVAVRVPLALLLRRRWRPHYLAALDGADAVVVGGGNLFTDMDLNFPTKVAAAVTVAAGRGLPVGIYGVGVGEHWSAEGASLVRRALAAARPAYVSVRDAPSKRRFDKLFAAAAGREAVVVRDPGFLVSRYVPGAAASEDAPVGVCITSGVALRYHSDGALADAALEAWYAALVQRIAATRRVVVFTNGSPEDEAFLDAAEPRLASDNVVRVKVATPDELARLAAEFAALVAHRMHALIAAASYGTPIFALAWDGKVAALMASLDASDRLGAAAPGTAAGIADAVLALAERPRPSPSRLVAEAFAGVGGLFSALSAGEARRQAG